MRITGVICEYNPFHRGHWKQLNHIREITGPDSGIVCLMSGNFVQRGVPAIADKLTRAKAAVLCGADLVLELPATAALSSAEGFAAEGVRILSSFCHSLCFGAEVPDRDALMDLAQALLSQDFPAILRQELDRGLSFPAARQRALASMGLQADLLASPNNILAVEYCKAILDQNVPMEPWPIHREGSYHDIQADQENPSATAVRQLMTAGDPWTQFLPGEAAECFRNTPLHTLAAGERAILARLRTMDDREYEALPYGNEGLWHKLRAAAHREATLEEIASAVKSKRYTRTRIDRMILCAFLGLTADDLVSPAPWVRVLAFNDCGRKILKLARQSGQFPNIGEMQDHPFQAIEDRCDALYGLFAQNAPEPPDPKYRVCCHR